MESGGNERSTRMACAFCRKRKLRCDRQLPKCESCQRLGFDCQYGPPRRQSKREQRLDASSSSSHVRRLENRLERVENLLQAANQTNSPTSTSSPEEKVTSKGTTLSESGLPSFDKEIVQELELLFFVYVHPSINIIHQPRYLQSLHLGKDQQPELYLRYTLCTLAASSSTTYAHLKDGFYEAARRHLQDAESKDLNFTRVTVALAQSWILIALYELKGSYLHRSMMSISHAVRLVQLLRLHQVDGRGGTMDPSLSLLDSPGSWLVAEERRRLFWFTFLMDRFAGISMGWPTLIDHRNIQTYLPSSNESFEESKEETSVLLSEALETDKQRLLSSFAAQVTGVNQCCTRIQEITHMDTSTDLNDWTGSTWDKSTRIEHILNSIFEVPQHLKIPHAKLEPSMVFLVMGQAACFLTIHRVARLQAGNSPIFEDILKRSQTSCKEAAETIFRMMKSTLHWDVNIYHPCTAFCYYAAALVYAETWMLNPSLANEDALRFMFDSLHSLKKSTRAAFNFLQDLERELPDLYTKLIGKKGLSARSTEVVAPGQPEKTRSRCPSSNGSLGLEPAAVSTAIRTFWLDKSTVESPSQPLSTARNDGSSTGNSNTSSELETLTSWTVDDPDIASIGRFL